MKHETPTEEARRAQCDNIMIEEALAFYNFDTLHICKKAQKRERLLLTAISLRLDTREAQLLADAVTERNRKGGENDE